MYSFALAAEFLQLLHIIQVRIDIRCGTLIITFVRYKENKTYQNSRNYMNSSDNLFIIQGDVS